MRLPALAIVVAIVFSPVLAAEDSPAVQLARKAGKDTGRAIVCKDKEADDRSGAETKAARAAARNQQDLLDVERALRLATIQTERAARSKGC